MENVLDRGFGQFKGIEKARVAEVPKRRSVGREGWRQSGCQISRALWATERTPGLILSPMGSHF